MPRALRRLLALLLLHTLSVTFILYAVKTSFFILSINLIIQRKYILTGNKIIFESNKNYFEGKQKRAVKTLVCNNKLLCQRRYNCHLG